MRRLETSARRSRPPAATNSRSADARQAHPARDPGTDHLPSGWRCTAAMGSCRTFGGAHPSSSIGNGPPAPHRALQLVARERRSVRVLCWLLRLSRAVAPEVNPALFGHAPRDSARADQSTPPTYRHHALAHGANRRGSEHERPLVQHGAPCRSLGATTCHPRRAYSRPIQWPAIIATPATAPGAPLRLDHDRRQRRDGTRLWASRGPVGCRVTWST